MSDSEINIRLGWDLSKVNAAIVPGTSATVDIVATATQSDGSPLPSYDGWTFSANFISPYTFTQAFALAGDITGNGTDHTLTATLLFTPSNTDLPLGNYPATVIFVSPLGATYNCPAVFNLMVGG